MPFVSSATASLLHTHTCTHACTYAHEIIHLFQLFHLTHTQKPRHSEPVVSIGVHCGSVNLLDLDKCIKTFIHHDQVRQSSSSSGMILYVFPVSPSSSLAPQWQTLVLSLPPYVFTFPKVVWLETSCVVWLFVLPFHVWAYTVGVSC